MIGLDTNVLVRYLAQDDPQQSPVATEVMESLTEQDPGYLSIVTTVETSWVLARAYGVKRAELAETFAGLLTSKEIVLEHGESVRSAVDILRAGGDFADALIADLGRRAGCQQTLTFDRKAARRAGMTLIETPTD